MTPFESILNWSWITMNSQQISFTEWIIIQAILWFHRILGISFSGFAIDSNGRIYCNQYFRVYGLSLTVVVLGYDLYQYVWHRERHWRECYQMESHRHHSNKTLTTILIHACIKEAIWFSNKIFILVFFNFKGFGLIKSLIENYKCLGYKNGTTFKIIAILLVWGLKILVFLCFGVRMVETRSIRCSVWQWEYKLSYFYLWVELYAMSIISVIYSSQLNKLIIRLQDFIRQQNGGGELRLFFENQSNTLLT